ncbi:MAG: TonB family protein [Chloracidobacterium sp.]|nr:TonB family protein [Chloracidobacterium sp.]
MTIDPRRTGPETTHMIATIKFHNLAAAVLIFILGAAALAQPPKLTLADLLVGLRSKKVSLEDRNSILASAVRERGITFTLSDQIERELRATGASDVLVNAVREISDAAPEPKEETKPTPDPTPTPPDFDFYRVRADSNFVKGEFTLALADYDQAVSLRKDSPIAFLNRGRTHVGLNDLEKAAADFDRAIELDPKDARAYYNRGVLNERLGKLELARDDYQKAVDLDGASESAKAMLSKVLDQLKAREESKPKSVAEPPAPQPQPVEAPVRVPESLNMGRLTAANAVKMAMPVYPPLAHRSNIEGLVTVEIELDENGNVTKAKAVSGHQFLRGAAEDAARKSKFRPAMFQDTPVKGFGTVTYNFSLKQDRDD